MRFAGISDNPPAAASLGRRHVRAVVPKPGRNPVVWRATRDVHGSKPCCIRQERHAGGSERLLSGQRAMAEYATPAGGYVVDHRVRDS
jgi:hypothetical protein